MAKSVALVLENVRISYANLFAPKENLNGALVYSLSALINKKNKSEVKKAQAAVAKAIELGIENGVFTKAQAKARNFKRPLRDGDVEAEEGTRGSEYENTIFFNCSSKNKPGLMKLNDEGQRVEVLEDTEIYSGCFCHIHVSFYPFNPPGVGSRGVAVGLNHVLKVKDGPSLDGRVSAKEAFKDYGEAVEESDSDLLT